MSGLILSAVAFVWFLVVLGLTIVIGSFTPRKTWRAPLLVVLFLGLLVLPFIDEWIGKLQFERLCRDNAEFQVNRERAAGRTVYLAPATDAKVSGTWVPILLEPRRFVDAATGEQVISYNRITASGGWFARMISQDGAPLLFRQTCQPGGELGVGRLMKDLNINVVRR